MPGSDVLAQLGKGLNYSQGFGSGKYIAPGSTAPWQEMLRGGQAYNQQLFQGKQAGLERAQKESQFGQGLQFQREQLAQTGALGREQMANQMAMARVQADAATLAERNKQGWRQEFSPLIKGLLGKVGGGGDFFAQYQGPGANLGPALDQSPVYDRQTIQERANALDAQSDAALKSQQAQIERRAAGQGYGAQSPLSMALGNAAFGQTQIGKMAAGEQTRFAAREANAKQRLAQDQLLQEQFAEYQRQVTERGKTQAGVYNNILGNYLGGLFA